MRVSAPAVGAVLRPAARGARGSQADGLRAPAHQRVSGTQTQQHSSSSSGSSSMGGSSSAAGREGGMQNGVAQGVVGQLSVHEFGHASCGLLMCAAAEHVLCHVGVHLGSRQQRARSRAHAHTSASTQLTRKPRASCCQAPHPSAFSIIETSIAACRCCAAGTTSTSSSCLWRPAACRTTTRARGSSTSGAQGTLGAGRMLMWAARMDRGDWAHATAG